MLSTSKQVCSGVLRCARYLLCQSEHCPSMNYHHLLLVGQILKKTHVKNNMSTICQHHVNIMSTTCQQHINKMSTTHQQPINNTSTAHQQHISNMSTTCQHHINNKSTTHQQHMTTAHFYIKHTAGRTEQNRTETGRTGWKTLT